MNALLPSSLDIYRAAKVLLDKRGHEEGGPAQHLSRAEVPSACDEVWPMVLAYFRH